VAWTITFHSRKVEEEILALSAGLVARFLRDAERMEALGPDLGMPHTRAMGSGRRIVVLHQFVKKTQQTPRRELETAHRRMKDVRHE